jgi:hypothetical protein
MHALPAPARAARAWIPRAADDFSLDSLPTLTFDVSTDCIATILIGWHGYVFF